jgi:hypothetical protein
MASNNLTGKSPLVTANHRFGSLDFIRSGAYCSLDEIAKLFNKRVSNWTRLQSTKDLFEEFRNEPAYNGASPFVDRNLRSESTGKFVAGGGLYAHPDIVIQFTIWCSPAFALWVSRQIRHLLTYGEVNLHYTEWTPEQHLQGVQFSRDDISDMYG